MTFYLQYAGGKGARITSVGWQVWSHMTSCLTSALMVC